jgi:hypothetical protein
MPHTPIWVSDASSGYCGRTPGQAPKVIKCVNKVGARHGSGWQEMIRLTNAET